MAKRMGIGKNTTHDFAPEKKLRTLFDVFIKKERRPINKRRERERNKKRNETNVTIRTVNEREVKSRSESGDLITGYATSKTLESSAIASSSRHFSTL